MGDSLEEILEDSPKRLNLFLNGLSIGEVGAMRLHRHLERHQDLTMLELRGSSIGHQGAITLATALKHHPAINHLGLARNGIDSSAAVKVVQALRVRSPIESLDLEWNSLDDSVAFALADMLRDEECCLVSLTLERNSIKTDGASAMANALLTNSTLRNLNLGFNRVGTAGASKLGEMLQSNRTLLTLNLSSNDIALEGGRILVDGLCANPTLHSLNVQSNSVLPAIAERSRNMHFHESLRELNLFANKMTILSAPGFGEALQTAQHVKGLSLGKTFAGDACFAPILNGITFMVSLGVLDISNASLTSESGMGIGSVLSTCTNLHTLLVDDNRLEPQGALPIAEGIVHATSLTTFSASNCGIKSEGLLAFAAAIQRRRGLPLQVLHFAKNAIDTDAAIALCDALCSDPRSTELTTVDLASNLISGRAGAAFLKLFAQHRRLLSLGVRDNIISDLVHAAFLNVDALVSYLESDRKKSQQQQQQPAVRRTSPLTRNTVADAPTPSVLQQQRRNRRGQGEEVAEATPLASSPPPSSAINRSQQRSPSSRTKLPLIERINKSRGAQTPLPSQQHVGPLVAVSPPKSNDAAASPKMISASSPYGQTAPSPVRPSQRRIQLHDVESNIGELCISETQLRMKFSQTDTQGKGYLTASEFLRLRESMDVVALSSDKIQTQQLVAKYAKDGKIYFDEFAVMMLKLVNA